MVGHKQGLASCLFAGVSAMLVGFFAAAGQVCEVEGTSLYRHEW